MADYDPIGTGAGPAGGHQQRCEMDLDSET